MFTIQGTEKIKGALDLGGINKQLAAGGSLPITEEEFTDHTVQTAIKMGLLTFKKSEIIESDLKTMIQVKNVYDRPLRINLIDGEIRPGQTFALSEDQINTSDIRGALAKGFLEIVSSVRTKESEESDIKIGNLFSEEPIKAEETPRLETNEEAVNPSVIDTEDPKPIEADDIDDPKGQSIVWNPNKEYIAQTPNQMKSVIADGSGETSPLAETAVDVSDISFVDEELDQKRRDSHPILKNTTVEPNDGIDFL